MPDDPSGELEARFDALDAQLVAVNSLITADMEYRLQENRLRDKRIARSDAVIRWLRRAIVVAVLLAAFAAWDAHDGRDVAEKANRSAQEVKALQAEAEADRVDRTFASCTSDNTRVAQLRLAVAAVLTEQGRASVATLTALIPDPDPNPARTQAQVAKLAAANDQNTAAAIATVQDTIGFARLDGTIYPERDCTPEGIAIFYAEQKAIGDRAAASSTTTTTTPG